jgi:hypothetical protein
MIVVKKAEGKRLSARSGLDGVRHYVQMDRNGILQEGVEWSWLADEVLVIGSFEG